jgi:2-polyprenyl-3-methyl-5-hydroxy-6-metoxy-1,4-benzoquinol methylase
VAKPTSLLDFGCGTGNFLQRAHQSGLDVCGVEPSDLARQHAADLVAAPIYKNLDAVEKTFDVITLWHVLEHLPDLNQKLDQLRSRLTKNGTMFIAVPNHRSADALKYKEVWAGFDVPRHLWHFSQSSMQQLFRRHELKLEHVIPMKLDAYYVSLLSNKYLAKRNTIAGMFKALTDGLRSNLAAKKNNEYSSLIYVARK